MIFLPYTALLWSSAPLDEVGESFPYSLPLAFIVAAGVWNLVRARGLDFSTGLPGVDLRRRTRAGAVSGRPATRCSSPRHCCSAPTCSAGFRLRAVTPGSEPVRRGRACRRPATNSRQRTPRLSHPVTAAGRPSPVEAVSCDEQIMSETSSPPPDSTSAPQSIYAWLSCPACGSRDVLRGPRTADGPVEITCEDCGLTGRYGL